MGRWNRRAGLPRSADVPRGLTATVQRLARALAHPVETAYRVRGRLEAGRLFARYSDRARRAGLDRLYLVLSFDCDTFDDAQVAWLVHERLAGLGVCPAYAVPGALLRRAPEIYGRIAATGAEFLNHGDTEHTYYDGALGRHASCFFYDQLPRAAVAEDVRRGDGTVREVLGIAPRGFRAPHFGTFQRPDQLRFLHGVLRELGYAYSSSTVPLYGFRYGPAFDRFGLLELPVSGLASAPLETLDSWGCFAAPDRRRTPEDYRREGAAVARALAEAGAGILNVYADPLHVHDSEAFFETVAEWTRLATPASYGDIIEALR